MACPLLHTIHLTTERPNCKATIGQRCQAARRKKHATTKKENTNIMLLSQKICPIRHFCDCVVYYCSRLCHGTGILPSVWKSNNRQQIVAITDSSAHSQTTHKHNNNRKSATKFKLIFMAISK